MKALFVTGQPSCGKTTLVQHLVGKVREGAPSLPITGFVTDEVLAGKKGALRREGFDVVSVPDRLVRGPLARKGLMSRARTGTYGVDVCGFEKIALPLLEVRGRSAHGPRRARGSGRPAKTLVVIDEIGRMEMHSEAFGEKVKQLFEDNSVLLLGSLAAPRFGHTVPLAEDIKERSDVRTLHLKASTREQVRRQAEVELQRLLVDVPSARIAAEPQVATTSCPSKRRRRE